MDVHLVLKNDPLSKDSPNFLRSDENKIVFSKFQTQFDFKTVSYPKDDVFTKVAYPLIKNKFLKNEDALLLTLGPTNSGKSHLLFQNENSVVNETLKTIFDGTETFSGDINTIKKHYPSIKDSRELQTNYDTSINSSTYFSVSMFELYNDSVIDLLNNDSKKEKANYDIITDSVDFKLTPRNISKFLVNSYESAYELIHQGYQKRKTYPTFANDMSSRSHCFIFLNIHKAYANVLKTTRFTIVDLAGLERSKSSRTHGRSLREAGHTNSSLTELGRCLELISMNQFHRTCLRTNKLTRLVLNDFVKNKNPVSILVTLDPFGELGLILQTLRYIDPIKHQVLQRRSLVGPNTKNSVSISINHPALTSEIDKLRNNQKLLKKRIQTLESSIIETEDKIRRDLYTENEINMTNVVIKHKEEIDNLNEKYVAQTDQKLHDQANILNQSISHLENNLKEKSDELKEAESKFNELESKFNTLNIEFTHLNESRNEDESSFKVKYQSLESTVNELSQQNEALKANVESLQLSISASEASYQESMKSLKLEHYNDLETRNAELKDSVSKIDTLNGDIEAKSIEIQKLQNQIQSVEKLHEHSESNIIELKKVIEQQSVDKKTLENELELLKNQLQDRITSEEFQNATTHADEYSRNLEIEILSLNKCIMNKDNLLKELETEFSSKVEELNLDINQLKSTNQDLQLQIEKLQNSLDTDSDSLSKEIANRDALLKQARIANQESNKKFKSQVKDLTVEKIDLTNKTKAYIDTISLLEGEINEKKNLLLKAEENISMIKESNETTTQELKKKLNHFETSLMNEIDKANLLQKEIETLKNSNSADTALLQSRIESLEAAKTESSQTIEEKTREVETLNELVQTNMNGLKELQKIHGDTLEEAAQNKKFFDKYTTLKSKTGALTAQIVSVVEENKTLSSTLKEKDDELSAALEKMKKLTSRLATLEKHQLNVDFSSDNVTKALRQSSNLSPVSTKTSRKSLSVLDTDPLDDIGLPTMMSSPLKPPAFNIHSDSIEKDNTITLPVTQKKKKSSPKKLSKKEQLEREKDIQEAKTMESGGTPKSDRKKFKALTNSKMSDLNKQNPLLESPKVDSKLKKRRSLSPMKPGKKKLRRSIGPNESLEMLD